MPRRNQEVPIRKPPQRSPSSHQDRDRRRLLGREIRQVSILSMSDPVDQQHKIRHVNRQKLVLEGLHLLRDDDLEFLPGADCSSVASDPTATFELGLNKNMFQTVLSEIEKQNKEISESTRKEIKRVQSFDSVDRDASSPSRWSSAAGNSDCSPIAPMKRGSLSCTRSGFASLADNLATIEIEDHSSVTSGWQGSVLGDSSMHLLEKVDSSISNYEPTFVSRVPPIAGPPVFPSRFYT